MSAEAWGYKGPGIPHRAFDDSKPPRYRDDVKDFAALVGERFEVIEATPWSLTLQELTLSGERLDNIVIIDLDKYAGGMRIDR